jgi:hypothetical protein
VGLQWQRLDRCFRSAQGSVVSFRPRSAQAGIRFHLRQSAKRARTQWTLIRATSFCARSFFVGWFSSTASAQLQSCLQASSVSPVQPGSSHQRFWLASVLLSFNFSFEFECVSCCRLNPGCALEPPDQKSRGFVI